MAPPQPATPSTPGFEVERFGWTAAGNLEVAGRWYGVRGRRFVRPTLDVSGPQGRRRLLASLEHKPWAPAEGEPWVAAFPWEDADPGQVTVELAVAPGVVVALPALGPVPHAATQRRGPEQPREPTPSGEPGDAAVALLRRLATLRQERAAMTVERDAARSALANAERQRDDALAVRETVERERDEALAARDAAAATPPPPAAPDGAALERLEHERDALADELEAMKDERDAAVEELHAARSRRTAAPRQAPATARREPAGSVATPEAELRLTRALTVVVLAVVAVLVALLVGAVL